MKPLQVAGRTHCKDSVAVQVLLVGGDVKEACHGEGAGSLPAAMVHQLVNVFNAIPFPDCHGNALGLLEVHQVWLSGVLALLQPLKELVGTRADVVGWLVLSLAVDVHPAGATVLAAGILVLGSVQQARLAQGTSCTAAHDHGLPSHVPLLTHCLPLATG